MLDLVRIWQPDSAELMTISAAKAALGKGPYNHVAYMLWTSDKAYAPSLDLGREVVIQDGDGRLHVARVWTDQAVVAIFEELGSFGTHRASAESDLQDPPIIPEGYPDGLEDLDRMVTWGAAVVPRQN